MKNLNEYNINLERCSNLIDNLVTSNSAKCTELVKLIDKCKNILTGIIDEQNEVINSIESNDVEVPDIYSWFMDITDAEADNAYYIYEDYCAKFNEFDIDRSTMPSILSKLDYISEILNSMVIEDL